jgi:hypothetical protein
MTAKNNDGHKANLYFSCSRNSVGERASTGEFLKSRKLLVTTKSKPAARALAD